MIKPCKDHLGNEYPSVKQMCEHYNIHRATYYERIRNGWSIEAALTTSTKSVSRYSKKRGYVKDHKGNLFINTKEICRFYHIPYDAYRSRIKSGWSTKDALTKPLRGPCKSTKAKPIIDHEGNSFSSERQLCEFWNISRFSYRNLVHNLQWSSEDTINHLLNSKRKKPKHSTITFYNETFANLSELCDKFNVNKDTYYYRINAGWSQEEALGIIPRIKPSSKNLKINNSILIKEPIDTDSDVHYFKCDWNGEDAVMTRDMILNKARTQLAASFA